MPPRTLPPISRITLRFFRRIVRSYFRRHFRAVSIQNGEQMAAMHGPLIVFANHSSWWDPMVSILLAEILLPAETHYAPMDAASLAKYPILRRLGIFPVESRTARGAAQFLRTSEAILTAGGVLWITPQGRFADNREPALDFKPGLGALAVRSGATLLPLAIEYTFWDERLPETLLRVGTPIVCAKTLGHEAATTALQAALTLTMQDLRNAAINRDPTAFTPMLTGGRGTGGIYAFGRRLRSVFTRKPATQDHTDRHVPLSGKDQGS